MIKPAGNRRLAQWRVRWLIEHSTSHQLLWCIDSFMLRIRHCVKRQNVMGKFIKIYYDVKRQTRKPPNFIFINRIVFLKYKKF